LAESKGLELPRQADYSLAEIYGAGADTAELNRPHQIEFVYKVFPQQGPLQSGNDRTAGRSRISFTGLCQSGE